MEVRTAGTLGDGAGVGWVVEVGGIGRDSEAGGGKAGASVRSMGVV
jgi:hypothetical protein